MFKNIEAFSSFSVDDLQKAKEFYKGILGVDVEEKTGEMAMLTLHLSGGTNVFVYPKGKTHIPASFTILNFQVHDIDATVDELTNRGIQFLQYTGDIQTDKKGVFRGVEKEMGPNIAWFNDPAGNILAVLQE